MSIFTPLAGALPPDSTSSVRVAQPRARACEGLDGVRDNRQPASGRRGSD